MAGDIDHFGHKYWRAVADGVASASYTASPRIAGVIEGIMLLRPGACVATEINAVLRGVMSEALEA